MKAKKAKAKGKTSAKKAAKESEKPPAKVVKPKVVRSRAVTSQKKKLDIGKVREKISALVGDSARDIANEVIKVAKTGQLASAKYLFEVAGLYPATEQSIPRVIEDTLAHTLLRRMGLPIEPVNNDKDEPALLTSAAAQEKSGGDEGGDEENIADDSAETSAENSENEQETVPAGE